MHNHGSPLHPGSSSGGPGEDDENEMVVYEDAYVDFDDDDEMIEILDDDVDDENEGTDGGNLADDEEDGEFDDGPGMEGFEGQQPDYILTSHLENAVFCCCFDADGKRLITGGEDDIANVWDSTSIETQSSESPIYKCRGHKDSVVSVSFSWDSTYFSTCDLSGIVKVWRTADHENVFSFETGELSWSFWHSGSHVLFAGCDDGSIYMWRIPSGDCKIYTGSSTKCECGVLLPDGKRLLAGYADGTLKLFDLKSGEVQQNFTKAITYPSQILCVASHSSRQLVASGSSDGTVALFNSQNGKLITRLQVCPNKDIESSGAGVSSTTDSVEGIAFFSDPTLDCLACGSVSGDIVIWDVATMAERFKMHQDAGLTKILWDPKCPYIYTAGIDGVVRVIDARTCKIEKLLGRHKTEILDFCISKDGRKLASASEDGSVFVYNL